MVHEARKRKRETGERGSAGNKLKIAGRSRYLVGLLRNSEIRIQRIRIEVDYRGFPLQGEELGLPAYDWGVAAVMAGGPAPHIHFDATLQGSLAQLELGITSRATSPLRRFD